MDYSVRQKGHFVALTRSILLRIEKRWDGKPVTCPPSPDRYRFVFGVKQHAAAMDKEKTQPSRFRI